MSPILRSADSDACLADLNDKILRARIAYRIRSGKHNNFRYCEPVGQRGCKMHICCGPSCRVYFIRYREGPVCICWVSTSRRSGLTSGALSKRRGL